MEVTFSKVLPTRNVSYILGRSPPAKRVGIQIIFIKQVCEGDFGLKIAPPRAWTDASTALQTAKRLGAGARMLEWLQAEFGVNKAIATQLWERMSWQSDVINLQRSFRMPYPFIGVCGALRLEDTLFAGPDPLRLRGRLCLFYARSVMKRARDIVATNVLLGNVRGSCILESSLVDRYLPIYQAHSTDYRDETGLPRQPSWHPSTST